MSNYSTRVFSLLIISLIFSFIAYKTLAQNIPNGDFEEWFTCLCDPPYWNTNNLYPPPLECLQVFQSGSPYLPLPVSFAIPPIGSRVVCVGFSDLSAPDWSISLDDLQAGRVNLLEVYKHKFLAVEGRVSQIFTHGFGDGSVGPCFTVDAKITNGMTGGPVFSENGYACGVISAVAANPLEEPAGTIVSLLYPALAMNIRFGGHIRGIRVSSNLRLTDLITQGTVITDGTEDMHFYEA